MKQEEVKIGMLIHSIQSIFCFSELPCSILMEMLSKTVIHLYTIRFTWKFLGIQHYCDVSGDALFTLFNKTSGLHCFIFCGMTVKINKQIPQLKQSWATMCYKENSLKRRRKTSFSCLRRAQPMRDSANQKPLYFEFSVLPMDSIYDNLPNFLLPFIKEIFSSSCVELSNACHGCRPQIAILRWS